MSITLEAVRAALAAVIDPNTGKDLVSSKSAKNIQISGSDIALDVELGYPAKSQIDLIRSSVIAALKPVPGMGQISAHVFSKIVAHSVQAGVKLLPNVRNIIAVASGKGGVGKSTTAANLALALAAEGATVGLLDADIYGPSQPMMMGVSGKPESHDGKTMEPLENHGVQIASIGFMIDPDRLAAFQVFRIGGDRQNARQRSETITAQRVVDQLVDDDLRVFFAIAERLQRPHADGGRLLRAHAHRIWTVFVQCFAGRHDYFFTGRNCNSVISSVTSS